MQSNKKQNYRQVHKAQDCKDSWDCPYLLKGTCDDRHHPDDKTNARSLKDILDRHPQKKMLLIATSKDPKKEPICPFDPYLPISLLEPADPPL